MKRLPRPEHAQELIQEQQSPAPLLARSRRKVAAANPILNSFCGFGTFHPQALGVFTRSLGDTRAVSRREVRKSQRQAVLAARSTHATCFDHPTAGRCVFFATAVTAPALDTSTLSRPKSRPLAFAGSPLAHAFAAMRTLARSRS
jgi:hypothetical protein